MKVTFLGTGTSQGVPIICCDCEVCRSSDPMDTRLRTSVRIDIAGKTLIIDTGPDFRYQMIRSHTQRVDAVLYTHRHKDHIAGLDDIRAYNYCHNRAIDVYANADTIDALHREYDYIFADEKYPGIPEIKVHEIGDEPFCINDIEITPIAVMHYKLPVLGFRIGDFTYITDANYISPASMELIQGTKVLVLNALRREPHISHFTLDEALDVASKIGAAETYFTHISHQLGLHAVVSQELPKGVRLAYDGLSIRL